MIESREKVACAGSVYAKSFFGRFGFHAGKVGAATAILHFIARRSLIRMTMFTSLENVPAPRNARMPDQDCLDAVFAACPVEGVDETCTFGCTPGSTGYVCTPGMSRTGKWNMFVFACAHLSKVVDRRHYSGARTYHILLYECKKWRCIQRTVIFRINRQFNPPFYSKARLKQRSK